MRFAACEGLGQPVSSALADWLRRPWPFRLRIPASLHRWERAHWPLSDERLARVGRLPLDDHPGHALGRIPGGSGSSQRRRRYRPVRLNHRLMHATARRLDYAEKFRATPTPYIRVLANFNTGAFGLVVQCSCEMKKGQNAIP
jgi:hypothetical protein